MSDNDIDGTIEKYLKRIAKLLPDGFETEDLLEDLKFHIYESYKVKIEKNPEGDKQVLISEVLDELGSPEEIASEYGLEQVKKDEEKTTGDKWIYFTMRLTLAVIVVVLASWAASVITEGAVDFMLAVTVLLAFAVLEWLIRTQQTKDA